MIVTHKGKRYTQPQGRSVLLPEYFSDSALCFNLRDSCAQGNLAEANPTFELATQSNGIRHSKGGRGCYATDTSRAYLGSLDSPIATSTGDGLGDFTIVGTLYAKASTSRGMFFNVRYNASGFFSIVLFLNATSTQGLSSATNESGTFFCGTSSSAHGFRFVQKTGAIPTAGKQITFAYSRKGTIFSLYLNGLLVDQYDSPLRTAITGPSAQLVSIGGYSAGTGFAVSTPIQMIYAANKAFPDTELRSLSRNCWQIFKVAKRGLYFDVGAAGAYTLTSADGSFSLSGQTAGLLASRTLASNAAAYSLSGQIAALLTGRALTSETSSFALTGQTVGLLADKLLTATAGSFTLNGQSATLTYVPNSTAYVLTAADGAFLFSGQAAQLITGRLLTSNTAAFTLVGQDAALLAGRKLASSEAAFALDGVATPLLAGRLLTASEAAYSLAGQAATLIYTPVGAYILAANAATYSVSGQDALLLHNRILAGSEGSFSVTGINAGMFRGLKLSAGASAFLLSGQDITFTYVQGYTLTCATGSYTLSGQDAALITDRILILNAAGFTLTGNDATLRTGIATPVAIGDPDWQIVIKTFDFRTVVEGDDHRVIIH